MSTPEIMEPSACAWCGIAKRGHGRQYADAIGWHDWEQPSQEQILARMKARRLQLAVGRCGALPMPVGGERTLDVVEEELTGVNLALWEEVQAYARLRLALASAQRGRRELRELVRHMVDGLNRFDCPPPGEAPLETVTRWVGYLDAAEARVAELESERHTTNEALDEAAKSLREQRDRIAELEAWQAADEQVRPHREMTATANMHHIAHLEQRLRRARFVHTKHSDSEHCQHDGEPWPCPTLTAIDAPVGDVFHPCGCPKRFARHADGCPTQVEAGEPQC